MSISSSSVTHPPNCSNGSSGAIQTTLNSQTMNSNSFQNLTPSSSQQLSNCNSGISGGKKKKGGNKGGHSEQFKRNNDTTSSVLFDGGVKAKNGVKSAGTESRKKRQNLTSKRHQFTNSDYYDEDFRYGGSDTDDMRPFTEFDDAFAEIAEGRCKSGRIGVGVNNKGKRSSTGLSKGDRRLLQNSTIQKACSNITNRANLDDISGRRFSSRRNNEESMHHYDRFGNLVVGRDNIGGKSSSFPKTPKNGFQVALRRKKFERDDFLLANCQFIIRDCDERADNIKECLEEQSMPYSTHISNIDTLIQWSKIELVIFHVSGGKGEEKSRSGCSIQSGVEENQTRQNILPSCPICLTVGPVSAKMARCGHIYCYPCALHFLALSDSDWRSCVICQGNNRVSQSDLKSVIIVTEVSKVICVGDVIEFDLMARQTRSSLCQTIIRQMAEKVVVDSNSLPSVEDVSSSHRDLTSSSGTFKVHTSSIVSKTDRQTLAKMVFERELRELSDLYGEERELPEAIFIVQAFQSIKDRVEELFKGVSNAESGEMCDGKSSVEPLNSGEKRTFKQQKKCKQQQKADVHEYNDPLNESDRIVQNCMDFVRHAIITHPEASIIPPASYRTENQSLNGGESDQNLKHFYQCVDNRRAFLCPFNVEMIVKQFYRQPICDQDKGAEELDQSICSSESCSISTLSTESRKTIDRQFFDQNETSKKSNRRATAPGYKKLTGVEEKIMNSQSKILEKNLQNSKLNGKSAPFRVRGRVVDIDSYVMAPIEREKRWKYISHLPLTTPFQLVELDPNSMEFIAMDPKISTLENISKNSDFYIIDDGGRKSIPFTREEKLDLSETFKKRENGNSETGNADTCFGLVASGNTESSSTVNLESLEKVKGNADAKSNSVSAIHLPTSEERNSTDKVVKDMEHLDITHTANSESVSSLENLMKKMENEHNPSSSEDISHTSPRNDDCSMVTEKESESTDSVRTDIENMKIGDIVFTDFTSPVASSSENESFSVITDSEVGDADVFERIENADSNNINNGEELIGDLSSILRVQRFDKAILNLFKERIETRNGNRRRREREESRREKMLDKFRDGELRDQLKFANRSVSSIPSTSTHEFFCGDDIQLNSIQHFPSTNVQPSSNNDADSNVFLETSNNEDLVSSSEQGGKSFMDVVRSTPSSLTDMRGADIAPSLLVIDTTDETEWCPLNLSCGRQMALKQQNKVNGQHVEPSSKKKKKGSKWKTITDF